MVMIISFFIKFLNIINSFSFKLECFFLKFLPKEPSSLILSEQYRKFQLDPLPIIKQDHLPISFEDALSLYKAKHNGKLPKPINRRVPFDIPDDTTCPHCGASKDYLYDNRSGKKSIQCRCSVCDTTFSPNKSYIQQTAHFCPYCDSKLDSVHSREHFTVMKCRNSKCSFYIHNLKSLSKDEKLAFKKNPSSFKLHYITRIFSSSLDQLEKLQSIDSPSKVNLANIRNSKHILGLILTYYVNYGLSLRKTSLILREVHDIRVSHQTIANYAEAASHILTPWLHHYQYDNLSQEHCGDETYVKVLGKKAYVFFMCDSIKKTITSFNIFMKRDTFSAIQTFYSVLRKFKSIPHNFRIIVDGNPIYKAAQQYFQLNHVFFDLHQVIGLKNDDEVSRKYRPSKQIIERLNRTFKYSYSVKNGFSNIDKANEYMALFTTFFNFLRNHSSLNYKPPVILDDLDGITNMPRKWNILINIATNFHHDNSNLSSS